MIVALLILILLAICHPGVRTMVRVLFNLVLTFGPGLFIIGVGIITVEYFSWPMIQLIESTAIKWIVAIYIGFFAMQGIARALEWLLTCTRLGLAWKRAEDRSIQRAEAIDLERQI